jgi:hypothetical protein
VRRKEKAHKMPRTFPSQIVAYLEATFGTEPLDLLEVHQKIGAIVGFRDLYDQLPHELVRLSPHDYAELVAAVGTVAFGVDQFRATGRNDSLNRVGHALATAWRLIRTLQDEVPSTSHDLSFIGDSLFREMIGLDISAITTDLQSGEWKGATILAGSCCEALLLYGLQTHDAKIPGALAAAASRIKWAGRPPPKSSDPTDRSWDLFSYTKVAHELGLITDGTKAELGPARDYRNLIHPAKSMREKVRFDRGTAYVATGALEHVLSDLKRNL